MNYFLILLSLLILPGCAKILPGLISVWKEIETQDAVDVSVDKSALQRGTHIKATVEVTNEKQ